VGELPLRSSLTVSAEGVQQGIYMVLLQSLSDQFTDFVPLPLVTASSSRISVAFSLCYAMKVCVFDDFSRLEVIVSEGNTLLIAM
jgi:hypothetical protein